MTYEYLASPYTHDDPAIRELRYRLAREHTAKLLTARIPVYSPIVHCHDLAKCHALPHDAEFWKWYNLAMMQSSTKLRVLTIEGWNVSQGVTWEMDQSSNLGLETVLDVLGEEF